MQRSAPYSWISCLYCVSLLIVVSGWYSYAQVEIRDTIRINAERAIDDVTSFLRESWLDTASVSLLKSTPGPSVLALGKTGKPLEIEMSWGPIGFSELIIREPDGSLAAYYLPPTPSGGTVVTSDRNKEPGWAKYTVGDALVGSYRITLWYIGSLKNRRAPPIGYQVKIRFGGTLVETLSGTIPRGIHVLGRFRTPEVDELDHFAVTVDPDTIAFTETARIFAQAKDANNEDVDLDENKLLTFSLATNERYGAFIEEDGDTVKATPVVLDDVRYEDAKDGEIRFAAVTRNPDTVETSTIRVVLQSDTLKQGEQEIVILEQTLRILMDEPHTVQPVIPFGDAAYVSTVLEPRRESTKEFYVQLTRGGKPVKGHRFRLSTDYVQGSGGHDHQEENVRGARRVEDYENYGHFIDASREHRYPIEEDSTRSNGRVSYTYVASTLGDTMRIILRSLNNRLLRDTVSLEERIPDLDWLSSSENYSKIGGTCNHFGPRNDNAYADCRQPDNNHWATQSTLEAIDSIAIRYRRAFPDDERLQINDISLPFGGRFDINGGWAGDTDHRYHRLGLDVDVRSRTIPRDDIFVDLNENAAYDEGEPISVDNNGNGRFELNRTRFEEICIERGAFRVSLEANPPHYYIYFWDPDAP